MISLLSSDGEVVKSRVNFRGLERKACTFKCDFLVSALDKVERRIVASVQRLAKVLGAPGVRGPSHEDFKLQ